MNKENYVKLMNYWQEHRPFCKIMIATEKMAEIIVIISYALLLVYSVYSDVGFALRSAVTSIIALYLCTLLRFVVNAKRPYQVYETLPAMHKDTLGQSFPSRHLTSVAVIAVSMLYTNIVIGCLFVALMLLMGTLRVLLGVHFVKDVTVGAVIGLAIGIVGIYIFPLII